jgi:hypothetical protein
MSRPRRALGALAGATLLAATGLVSIDVPTAGAVGVGSFSIADAAGPEGTGGTKTLDFVVTISLPNVGAVAVDYQTVDGSAKTTGDDYTGTSDTLVIPAGQTSGVIHIDLGTDAAGEPNETMSVVLSNPEPGMTIADGTATGTIQNDDTPARTFSVADVSHPEGDAGGTDATFTVTLSGSSTLETSVDYTTSPVTATAGTDYGTASGTLTFPAGVTTKDFPVSIAGDTTDEANETFLVTLSNPDDAGIADGSATGTITDDDDPPAVAVQDAHVGEGNSGTVTLTFTATLSAASGRTATFDYATGTGAQNPATAGTDYTSKSGTVTFVPGDTSEPITISVAGDTVDEQDETFALNLSNPLNLTIPDSVAIGTIDDDEPVPTVSVVDASAAEGDSGTSTKDVTVTLSVPSGQTVTVAYATSEATATEPEDYATATGTVSFSPGETSKTFPVTINGDSLDEQNETVNLTLSSPTNATISDGAGILTITDDDATPSLSIDDRTVTESDSGTSTATFTVTLSAPSGQDVTVNASTADGTATAGEDYAPISNQLVTIDAGDTTATVSVNAFGDEVDEADETATLNLSGATHATVGDGSGLLTITDDDSGPSITINDVTAFEGTGAGTTAFSFTATLSAPSEQTVTAAYATQNGTAAAPGDFATASGTLTFNPEDTTENVVVNVVKDAFAEPAETFTVVLSTPTNASIADGTGTGTINNDDGPAATLSIADDTTPESEAAVFTITLSQASAQAVTVQVSTSPDDATPTADYDPAGATKTITAGSTSTTFTVPIVDDTIDEPSEDFDVTLSNATNAAIADGSAVGTITDDDDTPSISVGDVTAGESSGTATVGLTLSNARSVDVTVHYATANGTAETEDYTSTSGTATFTAGSTSTSFGVPITSDSVDEASETVAITLSTPTNATIADGDGVLTITDDDAAPTVSIADVTAIEGDAGTTGASFGVTLSTASEQTATVTATTSTGTANATDFTAKSATVTFVPGDTSESLVVSVVGDTKAEINESFTVTLSSPSQVTINDGTATGTITEDDGGGTFTAVAPARILDTRSGVGRGGSTAKVGPGQTITLDVTGVGNVPTTGVGAVVINVGVTQPTAASGHLSVTPNGGSTTSNLNFVANQTVANLVTVPVGGDGNIRIYNSSGTTHVFGDVVGWYANDASTTPASHYRPVAPARILDTRTGVGRGGSTAKVGPGQTIVLDVTGVGGVPNTGVAAVVVNTTVTQPTAASGHLSVTPNGGSTTSNINFTANLTVANLVTVPVGNDGNIRIYNSSGATHVIGDVVGWYTKPGTLAGSVFKPVSPARVLDTRTGVGRSGSTAKVGPRETITVDVTNVGGVPASGVAAVAMTTTVTQPTATGNLSVTPNGGSSTSTLNFTAGRTVPNLALVPVGAGGNIRIYNSAGTSHIVGDIAGWFTAPAT